MEKNTNIKKTKRFNNNEVLILIIISGLMSFVVGFLVFSLTNNTKLMLGEYGTDKNLKEIIRNYNYILNTYYKELDQEKLVNGAIKGMLDTVEDPHTTYLDETASDNFDKRLTGYYQGIGIEMINDSEGNIRITDIFENSAAAQTGLKIGDIIVSINGINFLNKSTTELITYVKNEGNNELSISIKRSNEELNYNVKSKKVVIPSVASELIEKNNKKIGYIRIGIFALNTSDQFEEQLRQLENKGIDSLIIDVRDNSGGHLSTTENILSLFLNNKKIMYQMNKKDIITKHYAKGTTHKEYKVVVLGNQNSASASEVLIAALQEGISATFVGTNTYGKGTVQRLIKLDNNEEYKITTQNWLTPSGNLIDGIGIKPDVEVELYNYYYQNPSFDSDNQLQKAIEILTK